MTALARSRLRPPIGFLPTAALTASPSDRDTACGYSGRIMAICASVAGREPSTTCLPRVPAARAASYARCSFLVRIVASVVGFRPALLAHNIGRFVLDASPGKEL